MSNMFQMYSGSIFGDGSEYLNPVYRKKRRKKGAIKQINCGFDIIWGKFFVLESTGVDPDDDDDEDEGLELLIFNDFEDYFDYLGSDIYDNSCYYQYDFTKELIDRYNLDVTRLGSSHLTALAIGNVTLEEARREYFRKYRSTEADKDQALKILDESVSMKRRPKDAGIDYVSNRELFWDIGSLFIQENPEITVELLKINKITENREAIDVLMSVGKDEFLRLLPEIAQKNHIKRLTAEAEYIGSIVDGGDCIVIRKGLFNETTHLFEINEKYSDKQGSIKHSYTRYYRTIDVFVEQIGSDLSGADLSAYRGEPYDFSTCTVDGNTLLPPDEGALVPIVSKRYDPENTIKVIDADAGSYVKLNGLFEVKKTWRDASGVKAYEESFEFGHYFDFVHFLGGDLSGADLICCDGLENIKDFAGLVLADVHCRSHIMERMGIQYEKFENKSPTVSFEQSVICENATRALIEASDHHSDKPDKDEMAVHYISDIHLMHKLLDCKSDDDVSYELQKIVSPLNDVWVRLLLIAGDTSTNFHCFKRFLYMLKQDRAVFTLGNHELWEFEGMSLPDIVGMYREVIESRGMFLVQNSIVYLDSIVGVAQISEHDLECSTVSDLRSRVRTARLIIFGGIAFSRFNEDFNADSGIYRGVITREQEIEEGEKFSRLYDKVCSAMGDKNVVILTHTPVSDWNGNNGLMDGFVYVNGHNHRNFFSDDGNTRIYADNQVGYRYAVPALKYFLVNRTYDWFSDMPDGIHSITRDDYRQFLRGMDVRGYFNRDGDVTMLKKDGYYCFIYHGRKYSIMDGGQLKALPKADIQYYYDNMDRAISLINEDISGFMNILKEVSSAVKAIGGDGGIHGAIVDIDFFNHIYVNPLDGTITGYYALSVVDKYVYPSVPALLKAQCPDIYDRFLLLAGDQSGNGLGLIVSDTLDGDPTYYPETDIYRSSRQILKMQKLEKRILTIWPSELDSDRNLPIADGK